MKNYSFAKTIPLIVVLVCAPTVRAAVPDVVGPTDIANISGSSRTEPILVDGELRKTDGGTLSLSADILDGRGTIVVPRGELELLPPTGAYQSQFPTGILMTAETWLDASVADSVQLVEGSEANVWQWLDCRESDFTLRGKTDSYAYRHWMALTNFAHSAAATEAGPGHWFPTYIPATAGETAGVDFGGYGSGQCLHGYNANGASAKIESATWVFAVYSTPDYHWGFMLNTDTASFVPQSYNSDQFSESAYFAFLSTSDNTRRLETGLFQVDRTAVNPFTEKITAGVHVMAFPAGATDFHVQGLFNDRTIANGNDGYRQGGGRLHELVIFTRILNETERDAVENYLYRKWVVAAHDTPSFRTGAGASVSLTAEGGVTNSLAFENSFTKRGAGRVADQAVDGTETRRDICVCLEGGSSAARRAVSYDAVDGAQYVAATGVVTRVATSDATTLLKTGCDELAVRTLDADVKNLIVREGTLRLTRATEAATEAFPTEFVGVIEDPSFEAFADKNISPGGWYVANGSHGWSEANGPSGGGHGYIVRWKDGDAHYSAAGVRYPDGEYAGVLHLDGGLRTTVTLPTAGVYRVSFSAAERPNYSGGEFYVLVDGVAIGKVQTCGTAFRPYAFETPLLATGDHTLTFRADDKNAKSISGLSANLVCMFDDVHVDWVAYAEPAGVVTNGGFDLFPFKYREAIATNEAALVDWTLSNHDATDNLVMLARPGTSGVSFKGAIVRALDAPDGNELLMMYGCPTLKGRVVFSKAGTYALTLRYGYGWYVGKITSIASMNVKVGSLLDATVTATTRGWTTSVTAGTFTVPESLVGQALAVELTGTTAGALGLIDTIAVSAVESATTGTFVTNTFTQDGWETWVDTSAGGDANGYVAFANGFQAAWEGSEPIRYDNQYRLLMRNRACVHRTEHLDAGTYRLSVAAMSRIYTYYGRVDDPCYGALRVAVWIGSSDGTVTNRIGEFRTGYAPVWAKHSFTFTVPEDADYRIGFSGLSVSDSEYDGVHAYSHGASLDGLCIEPVTVSAAPVLDPATVIQVAEGARLALDTGATTNTVGKVRLGSKFRRGVISAETYPDYITGTGALYVPPAGLMVILR